jgi:hypothetical protein
MSLSADHWTKHFLDQATKKQGGHRETYKVDGKADEVIKIVSPAAQTTDMARQSLKRSLDTNNNVRTVRKRRIQKRKYIVKKKTKKRAPKRKIKKSKPKKSARKR